MKILSMTATFGKLENETLDLRTDLNVLSAPNEWGKSTWCAFLTAMLYGIDLQERPSGDQLPDRERYLPWSGKPMSGTMRVLHQGRDITIQRKTRGRIPMGDFLAWETNTGLAVRELTAENCGQVLLGVEKSVFLRTGFLRFSDLPVRQDETLRRRLNSLVTTGDETGDAELLDTKLRELREQTAGDLLPQCQSQIRQLQEQLWERQRLQKQHDALSQQVRRRESELEALENHRSWLTYQDAKAHEKRIAEARDAALTAEQLAETLREKHAELPERSKLEAQLRQNKELLEEYRFDIEQPPSSSTPIIVSVALAVVMLIAALLTADHGLLIPCIVLAVVFFLVSIFLMSKQRQKQIWHNIQLVRRGNRISELEKTIAGQQRQLDTLSGLAAAGTNAKNARSQLSALQACSPTAVKPEVPDTLTLSREDTLSAIGALTPQLSRDRTQLGQCRGRMEHLPEPELLQRALRQARRRLAELEQTLAAIDCALGALETAKAELQRRFAPRIAQRAGFYLSRLTGGVYDRIVIGDDLTVQAARDSETTLRSPQWRSEGTGDQMYLALRLAVWEVLAPQCPLILDDALIRFDQRRMERAMELLKELSQTRQILLFSCQEREREYLNR